MLRGSLEDEDFLLCFPEDVEDDRLDETPVEGAEATRLTRGALLPPTLRCQSGATRPK